MLAIVATLFIACEPTVEKPLPDNPTPEQPTPVDPEPEPEPEIGSDQDKKEDYSHVLINLASNPKKKRSIIRKAIHQTKV